ncbi:uroporphyrin-III C-methyltransferase [Vermiconidia calcicola]|uniref:Uroporphyrin-III C-methyltransferase n=1 Tax=Vermiconidia calcicola TaxID=1690605 RepID=A0ACC3MZS9_9PEZI|nr:uroporphyrin-III C-methyltransferase [Vermiconidia calcicola]
MSTLVWPPISHDELVKAEEDTINREIEWLLSSLQDTLQSLKAGLEECAELLAPKEPGSTLVLSSLRSENLKGFITRVGTRVVKGDVYLRLPSLPPPKGQNAYKLSISTLPTAPTIVLEQLTTTRTLINACLDVVDATRWTGDSKNANFISGQLRLLHDNIQEAKGALKGWTTGQKAWHEDALTAETFNPLLPDHISFHLSVSEAAILLNVRTLEAAYPGTGTSTPLSTNSASTSQQSYSGFSLREKLVTALGGGRPAFHDEAHEVFMYKGQEVRVRDKVRVESQDPSLMSAMAKLGALERSVAVSRRALDVVMGLPAITTSMTPALLTATDSTSHIHLIIGSNPLAGARCSKSLEVGAKPILIAPETDNVHYGLLKRIEENGITWLKRQVEDADIKTLGREEVDHVVDAVFVTSGGRSPLAAHISALCTRLRIPVNVTDSQSLSTFMILSTHTSGPLQIGVTTSGKGCKLASRIRREVVSALPYNLGDAVERLGTVRRRIWEQDHANEVELDAEDDDAGQNAAFNKLVTPTDTEAAKARRMRWLAQICEYWPLSRLAAITDDDVEGILQAYKQETKQQALPATEEKAILNPTTLDARRRRGRIILAGSGPGHPDLLTTATMKAIRSADLILADKLVPAPVLELVPRRTPIHIARKFPGNADNAQEELHRIGLEGLKEGKTVLRLKQGDPYLYGRGAEEVAFFREHAYEATVLPGITSSLSAPLFAKIPVTHRAVSDQILVCTGTGRKGAAPEPPAYLPNQTVVFLMALHRLKELVSSLTKRESDGWPASTPCAVIERASCPDQRVIRTSLEYVNIAVEEEGSRPPGLLVVGAACEVLQKSSLKWVVEDGFHGLDGLDGLEEASVGLQG